MRLKLELKYTMEMYSNACKEVTTAKRTTTKLHKWKVESEHKLEEARLSKEAAMAMAEIEKAKRKAAMEAVVTAHRIAGIETETLKESEDKNRPMCFFSSE